MSATEARGRLAAVRTTHLGEAVAVVTGALLLAGSWVMVAARDTVPGFEVRAFDIVNELPDILWPIVWLPMQLGTFVASLVVVAVTAVVTRDRRLTLATLVASQGAFWTAKVVKALVSRGRPADVLTDVDLRERAAGFGYVSGHTAVAFALAAVLTPSLPRRWRPVVFGVAAIVGLARIYGGVHLPLDVVGGAGIGLLWGTGARWAFGLGGEGLPVRPITHDL